MKVSLSLYIKESIQELKKVIWPTREETINHTLMVIGISLALAVFLGVVDYLFNLGLGALIQ